MVSYQVQAGHHVLFSFLFRHCNPGVRFRAAGSYHHLRHMVTLHDRHGRIAVLLRQSYHRIVVAATKAETAYQVHEMASRLYALPPVSFATYNVGRPARNQRPLGFGPRLHQLSQVDLPLLRLLTRQYTIFVQISIIQG